MTLSNREANGTDAGIEIQNLIGNDVAFYFFKSQFVNWEIDLEETIGGVGITAAENGISEWLKSRVRLMIDIEPTGYFTFLVTAQEERLIFTSLFAAGIEIIYNFTGF